MSLPIASASSAPVSVSGASAATGPVPAHKALSRDEAKAQQKAQQAADAKDGFSFADFIDIINPLQHIPIVGTLYREMTGDTIKGSARVLGGALFGGPIGAVLGGVNAVVASENNGKDIGELAMNKIGFGGADKKEAAQTAAKDDKNIPVVEVHPSDKEAVVQPIGQMPFARISANEIVWDDASVKTAVAAAPVKVLPSAKHLNELKPVAGLDPLFDAPQETAAKENMRVASADKTQVLAPGDVLPTDKTPEAAPAPAPVAVDQVPNVMMDALNKYQTMQSIGDKALIRPQVSAAPAAAATNAAPASKTPSSTSHPFGKLKGVRVYSGH